MPNGTGTGIGTDAAPVPKLHLAPQRSDVLLGPVVTALGALEWRTERYVERLKLSDEDAHAIRVANAALKQALSDIQTVQNGASHGKAR